MKKIIVFLLVLGTILMCAKAQNINGVSTNPQNPVNPPFLPWANLHLGSGYTLDPFLNQFNWSPVSSNGSLTDFIPVQYNTGFNIANISLSSNQIPMKNPFNTGMDGGLSSYMSSVLGPSVSDRDFRWEDGWELLWMNLGYTPDLNFINTSSSVSPLGVTGPNPVHAPYFVLYNRYKGTMRLFANVWFNVTTANKPQKVMTTIQFNDVNHVNGLLRHNNSYDMALDKKTIIDNITGATYNFTDQFKWLMSDFQLGFDPCICNRSTNNTKLNFTFSTLQTMNIDMRSRTIAVDKSITNNNYLSEDFLNLNDINLMQNCPTCPEVTKPGSRIYKEMGSMLNAYQAAQLKYESDLANYNSLDGLLKRAAVDILKQGVNSVGGMAGAGVAGSFFTNAPMRDFILKNKLRVGLFSGGLIKLDTNDANAFANEVTGGTKSIIAQGFDLLSTTFDMPGEPIKPTPPTATYSETTYKGNIVTNDDFKTDPLLVPGALPKSYPNGSPGVNKLNYPAYNEVLGLFALLETPKIEIKAQNLSSDEKFTIRGNNFYRSSTIQAKTNYQIKLKDTLKYRFNHVVDFNFGKTKLYYSFRIKFKNKKPNFSSTTTIPTSTYGTSAFTAAIAFGNHSIVEKDVFNFETYGSGNESFVVVTSPFIDVRKMLNEPISLNNVLDIIGGIGLNVDIFRTKDPSKFASELNMRILTSDYSQIESIDLKLMADMYFLSPGSKGQELNTLQTFTYNLYQNSGSDNQMPLEQDNTIGNTTFLSTNKTILKHQSGDVVFDNIQLGLATVSNYPFHWVSGNEIHIWVENAILKNNITVQPGFTAYIHFLGSASSSPETTLSPELVLDNIKSEDLYLNPLIYEATDTEVETFCSISNNKYKANQNLSKTGTIENAPVIKKKQQDAKLAFSIYPNPTANETTILYKLENSAVLTNINIYNITGELVQSLVINANETNRNQIKIDIQGLSAGIYFVALNASNNQSATQKLVIVK